MQKTIPQDKLMKLGTQEVYTGPSSDFRTIEVQRYPIGTLIPLINKLALEELATSKVRWENGTQAESGKSIFRTELEIGLNNCAVYRDRINTYLKKLEDTNLTNEERIVYTEGIRLVRKFSDDEELTTLKTSKELYEKEQNIYNSRFMLEFPLDKKINALYDNLSVVILRYCNISAIWNNKQSLIQSYRGDMEALKHFAELAAARDSRFDKEKFINLESDFKRCNYISELYGPDYINIFEKLPTYEEKLKFVQDNIEFTHCAVRPSNSNDWAIILYGKSDSNIGPSHRVLPSEYIDLDTLTLRKTMEITNNDLRQILQSKIDIDKENLEVVDEQMLRGDLYKILKLPAESSEGRYLIRYVCPSTQRVYFNMLDERSLSESKHYKRNDITSYAPAWWHINNCGEDPFEELPSIRF